METKQFNFVCENVLLWRDVARKKKKSVREKQEKQQLPFKSVGVTGRKNLGPFDGASSGAV